MVILLSKSLRQGRLADHHEMVIPRPRPRLHFTAHRGYSNDPHGLLYVEGRYHMFFQHNPDALVHTPHVSWGHAVSSDLLTWDELPPALVPANDEVGCWSGSAVITDDGPVIAFTRIATDDWDQGQVALARPVPDTAELSHWLRDPGPPVVPGPPDSPKIVAFRDPQIRADGVAWKAVIGGGLPGQGGCALQYAISPDLDKWTYHGVLATRAAEEHQPFPTGTVWECPQFLHVDGHWILIVSVWEAGEGLFVAYAIGDFDGQQFVPQRWGRFAHDDLQYATTTFTDSDGRPCAMSWMRESPGLPSEDLSTWRSAMTLPVELRVHDDALVVAFHRNIGRYFDERPLTSHSDTYPEAGLPADGKPWRLRIAGTGSIEILVTDAGGRLWELRVEVGEHEMQLLGGLDGGVVQVPFRQSPILELDIISDGDIVEIACPQAGGVAALRTRPAEGQATVVVRTDEPARVSLGLWREP